MAETKRRPAVRNRGSVQADGGVNFGNDIWMVQGAGVPTDGASGTGAGNYAKGSVYVDRTNGKPYMNTGTKASPTWTLFSSIV